MIIGFVTVGFAIVVGTTIGAVAGYWGGWSDNGLMRVMDVLLAFPALLLAIAIVAVLGPGLMNTLLAIAIVTIPAYARVTRSSVLSVKETDFISASKALGAGSGRVLFRSILPNAMTPLIVLGTLEIASAILSAAALSFLGLGAQPPTPEWGSMLGAERNQVFTAPHLVFFPGLAIMLTVPGFNLLGDGLRDALDPRLGRGTKSKWSSSLARPREPPTGSRQPPRLPPTLDPPVSAHLLPAGCEGSPASRRCAPTVPDPG